MAWHHNGSDTPTSARAILHHTDQNGPNILPGCVGALECLVTGQFMVKEVESFKFDLFFFEINS